MVNALESARAAARKALEATYEGRATVVEHQKIRNERTKLTDYEDVVVLEDQPCKLSFSNITTASSNGSAVSTTQTVKLFLSPDVTIKPGSKIIVTQSGVTTEYTYSGVPGVYVTHQEIMLDLWKEWA